MISGGNPALLFTGSEYDKQLTNQGNFLAHNMPDVDDFEDISCPDFFKLGDKWVLVCISHPRGARYYIGEWDGKQFHPQAHHRMNWPGGTCFAPETLLDGKGRRIFWAWNIDRKVGSTFGTMTIPRVLTLAEDGLSLNIEPVEEIETLRYRPKYNEPFKVEARQTVELEEMAGNSLELNLTINPRKAKRFGIRVFCSEDGREKTPIIFDLNENNIKIDLSSSSLKKPNYYEFCVHHQPNPTVDAQEAPFELRKGEKLNLRIFLDKSMLEIFANGRQCITQAVYPTLENATGIEVFADDSDISVEKCLSWSLFPSSQW
jgi:sucrose-6-phosphate hydrolase SacC (GH32 family)